MMKFYTILGAIIALSFSTASYANDDVCTDQINVKVDGLVCDFCARALEKVFSKRSEVEGINVNFDESNVRVNLNAGQTLDDETLTKLITDSGYSVREIKQGC